MLQSQTAIDIPPKQYHQVAPYALEKKKKKRVSSLCERQ